MDKINMTGKLSTALQELKTLGNYSKVIERLKVELKIGGLVSFYTYLKPENYDTDDKNILSLLVEIFQEIYNNGDVESPISDDDFDALYEVHRVVNEGDIVGASVGIVGNKVISSHSYPDLRGTLDKIHFVTDAEKKTDKRRSLEGWLRSLESRIGRRLEDNELVAAMTPKWDGISLIFEADKLGFVNKALTRGDTDKNEAVDVTRLFGRMHISEYDTFDLGEPFGLKTEVIMDYDDFEEFTKTYGRFNNPRSAVSSIFSSDELDQEYLKYITIMPILIQYLNTGIEVVPKQVTQDYPAFGVNLRDLDEVRRLIGHLRRIMEDNYKFDIDGVVIRLTDPNIQKLLGRENNINRFEFAFKFPAIEKRTTVRDVEFSVGPLGSVTPMAKIKPIIMKGNKIQSVNLGSIDVFNELNLREGDEVIIGYDIIPTLRKDNLCSIGSGKVFKAPTECPICKEPLEKYQCVNASCDSRKIGRIFNYVTKMAIPEISIGTITTLYQNRFLDSIEDLYLLKDHKKHIALLPGFGKKSVENIINGIKSRSTVFDYDLLGSLGIVGVGRRIFKKILNIYNINELIDLCDKNKLEKLTSIGGIQNKTAEKIAEGIRGNKDLIKFLRSQLKVNQDAREYNVRVCFTKIRDHDFARYLDNQNVLVLDDYNNEVDILIVPSLDTTSTKIDKAKKAGKEILSIDQAYKVFGYNGLVDI